MVKREAIFLAVRLSFAFWKVGCEVQGGMRWGHGRISRQNQDRRSSLIGTTPTIHASGVSLILPHRIQHTSRRLMTSSPRSELRAPQHLLTAVLLALRIMEAQRNTVSLPHKSPVVDAPTPIRVQARHPLSWLFGPQLIREVSEVNELCWKSSLRRRVQSTTDPTIVCERMIAQQKTLFRPGGQESRRNCRRVSGTVGDRRKDTDHPHCGTGSAAWFSLSSQRDVVGELPLSWHASVPMNAHMCALPPVRRA